MMDYVKSSGCYQPLTASDDIASSMVGDVAFADITKATPVEFAKQITLIELSFFKAIQREEFASLKWNGREKYTYAPNIVASTRWFNQINFWVQKEILKYSCVSKRTELLAFFIKVAKKLVDFNNLYSAMSIVSALQVECIYRLRHTWAGLGNKDRATYRRLEELFSQDDNCRRQREHMNSISLPGIPYLGLYLSDLTYTNVAQPRVNGKPTSVWLTKINAIIDTIAYFQQSEYTFAVDETLNAYLCAQRYIEEFQKFLEEENYQTSLILEPPPAPATSTPLSLISSSTTGTLCANNLSDKTTKFLDSFTNPSLFGLNSTENHKLTTNTFGFRSPKSSSHSHYGNKSYQTVPSSNHNHTTNTNHNNRIYSNNSIQVASVNSSFEADLIPSIPFGKNQNNLSNIDNEDQFLKNSLLKLQNLSATNNMNNSSVSRTASTITATNNATTTLTVNVNKHQIHSGIDLTASNFSDLVNISNHTRKLSAHLLTQNHNDEIDDEIGQMKKQFQKRTSQSISSCSSLPRTDNSAKSSEQLDNIQQFRSASFSNPAQLPPIPPRTNADHEFGDHFMKTSQNDQSIIKSTRPSQDYTDHSDQKSKGIPTTIDSSFSIYPPNNLTNESMRAYDCPVFDSRIDHLSSLSGELDSSAVAAACAAALSSNLTTSCNFADLTSTWRSARKPGGLFADQFIDALASSTPPSSPKPSNLLTASQTHSEFDNLISSYPTSSDHFGVRVICHGVVQRRTVARFRSVKMSTNSTISEFMSYPSSPLFKSTIYASNSSLSTCSVVASGSTINTNINKPNIQLFKHSSLPASRPAGFSKWRRLWATLILVGDGLAAYMIYFEPKVKNAMYRNQFQAHQCQIHCLVNPPILNMNTNQLEEVEQEDDDEKLHTNQDDSKEVEVAEGSELLVKSEDKHSRLTSKLQKKNVHNFSKTARIFHNSVHVELGHHRDGSLDPNSFILTDYSLGKTYKFKPLYSEPSAQKMKQSLKTDSPFRSGRLKWFRKVSGGGGNSSADVGADITNTNDVSNIPDSPYSTIHDEQFMSINSHTNNRIRGLSAPGLLVNSTIQPPTTDIRSTKKLFKNPNESSNNNNDSNGDAAYWIQSIQTVLDYMQKLHFRQFYLTYQRQNHNTKNHNRHQIESDKAKFSFNS